MEDKTLSYKSGSTEHMPTGESFYPTLNVKNNPNPSKLYAIPLFGILIKIFMLIPAFFVMLWFSLVVLVFQMINPFVVLSSGKMWENYKNALDKYVSYSVKISLFIYGVTDKYPGFDSKIDDPLIEVKVSYTQNPSKFFAIPVIGLLARVILLIPYLIYQSVISNAAGIAFMFSWIWVLFKGKYPQTTFEMVRDSARLSLATVLYIGGASDKYPSFWISMNNKTMKIVLIVLGTITMLTNLSSEVFNSEEKSGKFNEDTIQQEYMSDYDTDYDYSEMPASEY